MAPGRATVGAFADQSRVRVPPGPSIVYRTGALASGRQSITLAPLARQKVPLWVTSTCQMVGPLGMMPALRTAPTRAMRPPLLTVTLLATRAFGEKVPGPRKV